MHYKENYEIFLYKHELLLIEQKVIDDEGIRCYA